LRSVHINKKVNKAENKNQENKKLKMNLQKVLFLPKNILKCNLHTSAAMNKIQAGRYKVTRDRSKPLTYEQSFWPEQIAIKKGMS
jgi:hypothetical protein